MGTSTAAPIATVAMEMVRRKFEGGRTRAEVHAWLSAPRPDGASFARHLFGADGDASAAAAITEVYADGDPPPRPAEVVEPAALDARAVTSPSNGNHGGRPPAPPHAQTADDFVAAEIMKDGHLTVRHWHGQWYAYTVTGWRDVAETEIQGRVVTYLRERPDLRKHATAHYAASVVLNLRAHDLCGLSESVTRPSWLDTGASAANEIAFANGVVVNVWKYATALAASRDPTDCMRPVSPEFFSSDFVPFDWNPDGTAERFHAYLERVQPDVEQVHAICRMLGILVADTTRYEVFWQLFGNGANGKTVLLDIIRALVGFPNISYVPLSGLVERFQQWPLATAKVNVCGELPTDLDRGQFHQIEGAFKDCISGGTIEVEKKGADKFTAPCRARFVMATNSLPTFFDRSDGIWRRLRVIPFPEQIADAEKDVHLAEKICATDMPGVMAWALQGLADVIRSGGVPDCPAGLAMKNRHRLNCDHERQFIRDNFEAGAVDDRVRATDMYGHYRDWINANGYRPLGAGKFYARVEELFPQTQLKMVRIDGTATNGFEGIRQLTREVENASL